MKMKKKILSVAVLAALGADTAQAVNVSADSTGQVILFPYYTVQGNEETYLQVVNTTDQGKAVKIRFREARDSVEVLGFNIYLSPYDVWVGAVVDTADGGAGIVTKDKSCTVPQLAPGVVQPFSTLLLPSTATVADTREGHVEIIEMGSIPVTGVLPPAIDADRDGNADFIHINGVPENCDTFVNNFRGPNSRWDLKPGEGLANPTGGLFGTLSIINIQSGTQVSVNATSLESVFDSINHFDPGDNAPTLVQASPARSFVMVNDGPGGVAQVYDDDWSSDLFQGGVNAVSATMMASSVMNGYSVNPENEAESAWIVTFPTRWAYSRLADDAPFTGQCEAVTLTTYDREERVRNNDSVDFSPRPPTSRNSICHEVNVIQFGASDVFSADMTEFSIPETSLPGTKGWLNMVFDEGQQMTSDNGTTFEGLPVIGFKAKVLGNAGIGVGSSYASAVDHVYTRTVSGTAAYTAP